MLHQSNQNRYEFLKQRVQRFHPYMVKNIATIIPSHPYQDDFKSYPEFQKTTMYYYLLQGWILNTTYNFGEKVHQETDIQHLTYGNKIQKIANNKWASPNAKDVNKYIKGQLFATINIINSSFQQSCSRSSFPIGCTPSLLCSSSPIGCTPSHPSHSSSFTVKIR